MINVEEYQVHYLRTWSTIRLDKLVSFNIHLLYESLTQYKHKNIAGHTQFHLFAMRN